MMRDFDVTEADMIEYWHYMWRKSNEITMPDYDADITIGGPIRASASNWAVFVSLLPIADRKQPICIRRIARHTRKTPFKEADLQCGPGMKLTVSALGTMQAASSSTKTRRHGALER